MAKKRAADLRKKRRTRDHVIADLAMNHVERQVLLCGHTLERMVHDYGIDFTMLTYNRQGRLKSALY